MKKNGFTLSEILIALGIIGVVAALTIPMLVKNYKNTVTVNKLKKGYTALSNVFNQAVVENGEPSSWAKYSTDHEVEYIENYVKPYIDYTEIDRPQYLPYKKLSERKLRFDSNKGCLYCYGNGDKWYQLRDGSCFRFVATNSRQYFLLFYDIKCQDNQPSVMGKDVFVFSMSIDYPAYKARHILLPFVDHWSPLEYYLDNKKDPINALKNNCKKDLTGDYVNRTCAGLIMQQGWKITDDYPWK